MVAISLESGLHAAQEMHSASFAAHQWLASQGRQGAEAEVQRYWDTVHARFCSHLYRAIIADRQKLESRCACGLALQRIIIALSCWQHLSQQSHRILLNSHIAV